MIETQQVRPVRGADASDSGQLSANGALEAAKLTGLSTDTVAYAVELAVEGTPTGWETHASCRNADPDTYFPRRGQSVNEQKKVCSTCKVQCSCLASALISHEMFGIWGGTSEKQRRGLRRNLVAEGIIGTIGEAKHLVWAEPGADREPPRASERLPLQPLRPQLHQNDAVAKIIAEIRDGGAAQIQMATGSGKTAIGPWLAAELGSQAVVVLVPNLQLVSQTAQVWQMNYPRPAHFVAACSDAGDIVIAATTSPDELAEAWKTAKKEGLDLVVFATYQSSSALAASRIVWDLAIADEAHHLAGQRDKAFAAILRGDIETKRCLYMTATPKVSVRGKKDVEVRGMDDPAFGRRVYELGIDDAIALGLIADYRVVIAAVEEDVFKSVASQLNETVDPYLLAGAIAVVRALERYGLRSLISYHTRIERASEFATLVGKVAELLPADERPSGPGFAGWVDGSTSVRIRDRLLS